MSFNGLTESEAQLYKAARRKALEEQMEPQIDLANELAKAKTAFWHAITELAVTLTEFVKSKGNE